jgi:Ca2+-binding RTX toxin-like protein
MLERLESRNLFTAVLDVPSLVVRPLGNGDAWEIVGTEDNDLVNVFINKGLTSFSVKGNTSESYDLPEGVTLAQLTIDLKGAADKLVVGGEDVEDKVFVRADGGEGNDTITGQVHGWYFGGNGNDHLTASHADAVSLRGGNGNDVLTIRNGSKWCEASGGEDRDILNARSNIGEGDDYGVYLNGGGGPDTLWGSPEKDWLVGGDGRDVMWAGAGDDRITADGDRMPDICVGGPGTDILDRDPTSGRIDIYRYPSDIEIVLVNGYQTW